MANHYTITLECNSDIPDQEFLETVGTLMLMCEEKGVIVTGWGVTEHGYKLWNGQDMYVWLSQLLDYSFQGVMDDEYYGYCLWFVCYGARRVS